MDPRSSDLRVLLLLLDDTLGPVMLLVTDMVTPFHIRIVGLHGQDNTVTALPKHEDAAFRWIEEVFNDLGISLIADMVTSFPAPDLHGIGFDELDEWATHVFRSAIESAELLLP